MAHQRNKAYQALYYEWTGNGDRPKRRTKTFEDNRLASIYEYKKDFEYYIRKSGQDPLILPDHEVTWWVESFLKRRKVKAPLTRGEVQLSLVSYAQSLRGGQQATNVLKAIQEHRETLLLSGKAASTIKNYNRYIRQLSSVFSDTGIVGSSSITKKLPLSIKKKFPHFSARSVDILCNVVKASLRDANAPPGEWEKIEKTDINPKTRSLMSIDELEMFFAAARKHQFKNTATVNGYPIWFAYFYTLYLTCRRASEILKRTWGDVSTDLNILFIRKQKGNAPPVFCPINDPILQNILTIPDNARKSDYIFATATGTHLDNDNAYKAFKLIAKDAGLPAEYSPHHFRHAATTYSRVLNSQVDDRTMRNYTGHTTERAYNIYQHIVPEAINKIQLPTIERLRAKLGNGTNGDGRNVDKNVKVIPNLTLISKDRE